MQRMGMWLDAMRKNLPINPNKLETQFQSRKAEQSYIKDGSFNSSSGDLVLCSC